MASIYDFTVKDIHGKDVKLDKYKGKALLIVNTASKCGFTPQYKGLEALYEKLKGKGFEILGFPCNQFGAQEPGTAAEIESFCEINYGVTFPAVRQDRRQRPARGAALPASQGGEARTPRVRDDQVELHQVPRRSRGQRRRALCTECGAREHRPRHRQAAAEMTGAGRAAVTALALLFMALAAFATPARAADPAKVLRVAFLSAETGFDPQAGSDLYSNYVDRAIFDPLYTYDYLARPYRIVPNTAAALPQISADGLNWTIRIRPGIHFADDPAFKGVPRELTAADYVYSMKRVIDPKVRSPNLQQFDGKFVGADALVAKAKETGKFDYDAPLEGLQRDRQVHDRDPAGRAVLRPAGRT